MWKSKFYGAFVLNRRVVLHAIFMISARRRGDAGSSPLDRTRTAASSRTRLISTRPATSESDPLYLMAATAESTAASNWMGPSMGYSLQRLLAFAVASLMVSINAP